MTGAVRFLLKIFFIIFFDHIFVAAELVITREVVYLLKCGFSERLSKVFDIFKEEVAHQILCMESSFSLFDFLQGTLFDLLDFFLRYPILINQGS